MTDARSVIVTLLPYHPQASESELHRARDTQRGKDYHGLLRKKLMKAGKELADTIGADYHLIRATVDSAPVDERTLAELAGLGWLGKNGLILHPQRGSYHFLAELWCGFDLPTFDGAAVQTVAELANDAKMPAPLRHFAVVEFSAPAALVIGRLNTTASFRVR